MAGDVLEVLYNGSLLLSVDLASAEAEVYLVPLPETRNTSGLLKLRLAAASASSSVRVDEFEVIVPAPPPPPAVEEMNILSSGGVQMRFSGEVGASITINFSDDLREWQVLRSFREFDGDKTFIDQGVFQSRRKFYRLLSE